MNKGESFLSALVLGIGHFTKLSLLRTWKSVTLKGEMTSLIVLIWQCICKSNVILLTLFHYSSVFSARGATHDFCHGRFLKHADLLRLLRSLRR